MRTTTSLLAIFCLVSSILYSEVRANEVVLQGKSRKSRVTVKGITQRNKVRKKAALKASRLHFRKINSSSKNRRSEELWWKFFGIVSKTEDPKTIIKYAKLCLKFLPKGKSHEYARYLVAVNVAKSGKPEFITTMIKGFDSENPRHYYFQRKLRVEIAKKVIFDFYNLAWAKELLDEAVALPESLPYAMRSMVSSSGSVNLRCKDFRQALDLYSRSFADYGGVDLNGLEVRVSDYRGRVLMLEFWSSQNSHYLYGQLPDTKYLYRSYRRRGFDILGVSLDEERDFAVSTVRSFKMPGRHLFNGNDCQNGKFTKMFRPYSNYLGRGASFSVLFDKRGRVRAMGLRSVDTLKMIEKLLKEKYAAEEVGTHDERLSAKGR